MSFLENYEKELEKEFFGEERVKEKKEMVKKILFVVAEIGIVIWAIQGIMREYCLKSFWSTEYHISSVWAYFLSAVLVLYLLRRYETKI